MKCLTVKAPWAWAICIGAKDIENRSRMTTYRGELLIHVGMSFDRRALCHGAFQRAMRTLPEEMSVNHPYFAQGAIIGSVNVVGCSNVSDSPWAAAGHWHWQLDGAVLFPAPIPCKGMLGLWNLPSELEGVVIGAQQAARLAAAA